MELQLLWNPDVASDVTLAAAYAAAAVPYDDVPAGLPYMAVAGYEAAAAAADDVAGLLKFWLLPVRAGVLRPHGKLLAKLDADGTFAAQLLYVE